MIYYRLTGVTRWYYSRMAQDFHWGSSILFAFATWISGLPWFPVEPYLPTVTPINNRLPPLHPPESSSEVHFRRFRDATLATSVRPGNELATNCILVPEQSIVIKIRMLWIPL